MALARYQEAGPPATGVFQVLQSWNFETDLTPTDGQTQLPLLPWLIKLQSGR